ncbi:hypothetical protein Gogos_013735 [Gossypium gossypioides]|uniref:RNase H type-1 domain-containing protein n=1 Tax=Gossypium gossypioides TaxID=34282 RepID=A0A7J9BWG4_GOSGO|nr:hypothetical protein [Gossypium gossypioides]
MRLCRKSGSCVFHCPMVALVWQLSGIQQRGDSAWEIGRMQRGGGNLSPGNKWMPPEEGCWKCNTDVATGHMNSGWGFGAIVRNERGEYITGIFGRIEPVEQPMLAEAHAIKEVLSWLDCGFDNVIVETEYHGLSLTSKILAKEVVELKSAGRVTSSLRAALAVGGMVAARTTAIIAKTKVNFFQNSILVNFECKLIETLYKMEVHYIEMPKIV